MNIIEMRQEKRSREIRQIQASIEKAREKKKKIIYKDLVLATMSNLNLSKRTAQDYIEIALFRLGMEKDELEL